MNFIDNIRAAWSGGKKKASPTGEWTAQWVGGQSDGGINTHNLLEANKEWVFIAVDRVAHATAAVRFKVMKYKGNGDDKEVFDGPLVNFLEKPGYGFTGKDFVYLNTVYKELTGNSFWRKQPQMKLEPLVPTRVTPNIVNGQVMSFKYTQGQTEQTILAKDVLHDRNIDPAQPWWGVGKLAKIARWVDTSSFTNEFLRTFFINGATFGGFITTEEESMDRIKLIKAGLVDAHTGVRNAHKMGVLPKGADYKQVTSKMSDMEMGATDDRYRDKILSAFGVPKSLVGIVEDVNRANAEANEYVFAKYTIKPIAEDLLAFLNVHIAPVLDPSGKTYFAYDDFIPDNRELKIREREVSLAKQQYKTINEARAEEGLPPVPGGDVIYGNPFQVPLGAPQASPEPVLEEDDEEDTSEPNRSKMRNLPPHIRRQATRLDPIEKALKKVVKTIKEQPVDENRAADELAHKDFVGRVEPFLDRIAKAVVVFNSEQKSRVVKELGRVTKAVVKSDLFNMDAEVAAMINVTGPLLRGLLTEQALAEYAAQGYEGTFDSGSEQVSKIVDIAAKRLAKTYNNTTALLLKEALNSGIQEGESLAELTARVQQVYDFSDTVRAKTVAHTESFYIANKGSQEAYRQSGVVKTQRWYTAEDEMVCPYCQPMNAKVIDIDDIFFNKGDVLVGSDGKTLELNYRSIDVPPIHPSCRCFIRPETISID